MASTKIFKYRKLNGSVRSIKTIEPIIDSTSSHITIWDCENQGYRTLICDRILNLTTFYKYRKLNGSIRSIKTNKNVIEYDNHIKIWDIENEGWRTMIKERILEPTE